MFDRFSPEARQVLVDAQAEARSLSHSYIGTEHLLLGLLSSPGLASPVAAYLARHGVHAEGTRRAVLEIVGPAPPGGAECAGGPPFTPRAKKVLELSLREALKLRHKDIGPEHLLLGILREGQGLAAVVLARHGVTLDAARQAMRAGRGASAGEAWAASLPVSPGQRMTAGARRVMQLAFPPPAVAASAGPVGTHDLLLALLREEQGLAARVLSDLGVTADGVAAKVGERGAEGTSDAPERPGRVVLGDAVEVRIDDPDLARRLRDSGEGQLADVVRRALIAHLEPGAGQEGPAEATG